MEESIVIYVGDSGDVVRRLSSDHSSGNVEASALRRHIARYKEFELRRTKRPSGSTRVRIDLPDPRNAENEISSYIHSGMWKYVLCQNYAEANDFQWFVIHNLNPLLNVDRRAWNTSHEQRYEELLQELVRSALKRPKQLRGNNSGPGVYVFYHDCKP